MQRGQCSCTLMYVVAGGILTLTHTGRHEHQQFMSGARMSESQKRLMKAFLAANPGRTPKSTVSGSAATPYKDELTGRIICAMVDIETRAVSRFGRGKLKYTYGPEKRHHPVAEEDVQSIDRTLEQVRSVEDGIFSRAEFLRFGRGNETGTVVFMLDESAWEMLRERSIGPVALDGTHNLVQGARETLTFSWQHPQTGVSRPFVFAFTSRRTTESYAAILLQWFRIAGAPYNLRRHQLQTIEQRRDCLANCAAMVESCGYAGISTDHSSAQASGLQLGFVRWLLEDDHTGLDGNEDAAAWILQFTRRCLFHFKDRFRKAAGGDVDLYKRDLELLLHSSCRGTFLPRLQKALTGWPKPLKDCMQRFFVDNGPWLLVPNAAENPQVCILVNRLPSSNNVAESTQRVLRDLMGRRWMVLSEVMATVAKYVVRENIIAELQRKQNMGNGMIREKSKSHADVGAQEDVLRSRVDRYKRIGEVRLLPLSHFRHVMAQELTILRDHCIHAVQKDLKTFYRSFPELEAIANDFVLERVEQMGSKVVGNKPVGGTLDKIICKLRDIVRLLEEEGHDKDEEGNVSEYLGLMTNLLRPDGLHVSMQDDSDSDVTAGLTSPPAKRARTSGANQDKDIGSFSDTSANCPFFATIEEADLVLTGAVPTTRRTPPLPRTVAAPFDANNAVRFIEWQDNSCALDATIVVIKYVFHRLLPTRARWANTREADEALRVSILKAVRGLRARSCDDWDSRSMVEMVDEAKKWLEGDQRKGIFGTAQSAAMIVVSSSSSEVGIGSIEAAFAQAGFIRNAKKHVILEPNLHGWSGDAGDLLRRAAADYGVLPRFSPSLAIVDASIHAHDTKFKCSGNRNVFDAFGARWVLFGAVFRDGCALGHFFSYVWLEKDDIDRARPSNVTGTPSPGWYFVDAMKNGGWSSPSPAANIFWVDHTEPQLFFFKKVK